MRISDWSSDVCSSDLIDHWQVTEMRQIAHRHLIQRYADDLPALSMHWKQMPAKDRLNPRLAYLATSNFIRLQAHAQALEIIESSLSRQWDNDLAALLGECFTYHPPRLLQQAERWS